MSTRQHEWAAFIALIPYFSGRPGRANIRDRLMTSLRQCGEPVITHDAILARSGLSFFAEDFEVDLALMQLIRDGVIFPVTDAPSCRLPSPLLSHCMTAAKSKVALPAAVLMKSRCWLQDKPLR